MKEKMVRMSFTVPPSFRDDLRYVSRRLGISQSAVVSQVFGTAISDVSKALQEVPLQPTEQDAIHFRDSSVALVDKKLAEVRHLFEPKA